MKGERWERVGELFDGAMEVAEGERERWVRAACGEDGELAEEVLSLLASDAEGEGFVAGQVAPAVAKLMEGGGLLGAPVRVGPYRLVSELGRGGMGTVYLAERDDAQYQTQVAIKLVRRGMDTDLILHRFYRERQTLARLQHPHIARLLDGGMTEERLPYIVMEYVKGSRITEYCRERGLGVRARLELFLDVCDAVAYAHRQFVVHRDLKPGNILVDETGAVKLLDFGICKLLHAEAGGGEVTVEAGPAPLTPEYASPEQILGKPTNIASDVYSLGAVLYELLTGEKPHKIVDYSLRGIEKGICEAEIVRPGALARHLAGDLDTILMHALEKDPGRRYASIEQFAEDVRRHLTDQPVRARPDTVRYRVGKFLKRRKGLTAAAAAVLLTLLAGVAVSMQAARRANESLGLVRQLSNTFVFDVYDAVQELPG
jgi:serine/threonine protein kinase